MFQCLPESTDLKTAEKESIFEVILVRIFCAFSRIWTEYGETPLRIQPECGKMREKCGLE